MENVKDISISSALTEDGEVWTLERSGEWSKIADNVKQIQQGYEYLKNDGTLYEWDGNLIKENVEYIVDAGYYVPGEGFYEYIVPTRLFVGDIRVKEMRYDCYYYNNGDPIRYDIAVTEDGEVWAAIGGVALEEYIGELVKLGEDCVEVCDYGQYWDWKDSEDNYYLWDEKMNPTEENPVRVDFAFLTPTGDYNLYKMGTDADNYIYRDGEKVLDHATNLLTAHDWVAVYRSDGSVWDVTGTPKKLGTLNNGDDIVSGDVTGDGKVQIDDLRLVLRAVCQKVTLTSAQKQAADVEQNGEVDIADLRLILRFVCGKVESL